MREPDALAGPAGGLLPLTRDVDSVKAAETADDDSRCLVYEVDIDLDADRINPVVLAPRTVGHGQLLELATAVPVGAAARAEPSFHPVIIAGGSAS